VIEEFAWTRVAQRGENISIFGKGLQESNPGFDHPLIVDGEGGLKVDEVSEHLGTTPGAPRYPNSSCIALLKFPDNSPGRVEGSGPGANTGSSRRKERVAGCFPLPKTININTITNNVWFDSYT